MKKQLKKAEKAINELVEAFIDKYFDGEDDWFWVGDNIGGVLNVGDMYLDFYNILEVARLEPTWHQFSGWYWNNVDSYGEDDKISYNLNAWMKLKSKI